MSAATRNLCSDEKTNVIPKIVAEISTKRFLTVFIIGFALDFICVARHSDQCSKLSCGISTLLASKAFTTVPIYEDIEDSR